MVVQYVYVDSGTMSMTSHKPETLCAIIFGGYFMKCNQCEKECNNKDCHRCKVCEFPLLCLCERTDKLFSDAKIKAHNSSLTTCPCPHDENGKLIGIEKDCPIHGTS